MKKSTVQFFAVIAIICIILTSCSFNPDALSQTASSISSKKPYATTLPETFLPAKTPSASAKTANETSSITTGTSSPILSISTVTASPVISTAMVTSTTSETPNWSENPIDEIRYLIVDCYEQLSAYKEAPKGSLLTKGSPLKVIAITNTNYYKTENNRFVHKDYTAKSKPSEPTKKPVVSTFEKEINNVKLNPVKTNVEILDTLIEQILDKIITKDMTNNQKLKAIYDYIISNSTYEKGHYSFNDMISFSGENAYISRYDLETVYLAYLMLSSGKGSCNYYSSAFTVLTRAVGFECYRTEGEVASSSGGYTGHVWNNLKIGEKWYEFDVQVEDKRSERNGYTSYTYYGHVRNYYPNLYIYPENTNLYIEQYKGFKFADPLIGDITIRTGEQKLELHYEQNKPNSLTWSPDYLNEYISYECTTIPELTIDLTLNSGTPPYDYEIYVYQKTNNSFDKSIFSEEILDSNKKRVSYKIPLSDFGNYSITFTLKDNSMRQIYKKLSIYISDSSPLKGEITIEKETSKNHIDLGNVRATFVYTGGGRQVDISTYAIGKKSGYLSSFVSNGIDSHWYNFVEGEEYEVFFVATDSKGNKHTFSKIFTYNQTNIG